MSRFYVNPKSIRSGKIYVDGQEAHHILDVMRLKKGDAIAAFDGRGREYIGKIEDVSKNCLVITIEETRESVVTKRYAVTLAQAIPKADKMDYIIQKASELGVDSIIPMNTERTVVRLKSDRVASRLKRWRRIAQEASKQCGRSDVAAVEEYSDIKDVIKSAGRYDLALMPSTAGIKKRSLKEYLSVFKGRSLLILIGPEGGFDSREIELASENGIAAVTLGAHTLRSDTAAIASIAMINYALNVP